MTKLTVQQIFQAGYAVFAQGHRLPDYVRRAAWAILVCRTAVLGGHVQACPEGHIERVWYNSCRHRLCPQCSWLQIERWLASQKARLLACDHYHVIFTLPDELRGLWLTNVRPMTNLLFATVWETLGELLSDPKYLGAQPGLIAALHTWSQTLVLHPHLHCIVTGCLRRCPCGSGKPSGTNWGGRSGMCTSVSGIRMGRGCSPIWRATSVVGPCPTTSWCRVRRGR